ncbi:MAG TPA: cation:proton antiporter [Rubricoccaceae bacterium]|jgi:NhaP-type Na+/H+ or K+/H+ antiporter
MDPRILTFILVGLGLWGAVALQRPLKNSVFTLPMLYIGFGWLAFTLPLGLPRLDPVAVEAHTQATEYLTEFILIVSLMGAGLAIDRPFTWRGWGQVWPLLGVTMVLSVGAVAALGWWGLGLAPASALLLGAALSPTDPVLARSVAVGPPGETERDDVRFDLTVESGFNDGLAFPFTYLAIAAVGHAGLGEWALVDVLWRIAAGVAVGVAVGAAGGWYVFRQSGEVGDDGHAVDDEPTREGLTVVGGLLAAYGLAEAVEGYGFLAVFVGAVAARHVERKSDYHEKSHHFIDQLEEIVLVGMLLGFGGLLAGGILDALTVPAALLALAVVFVVRPLAGIAGTIGDALPLPGRLAVAFLGVRGMGTVYYIAYAQSHARFEGLDVVWATGAFAILVSVVVHGLTADAIMRRLERRGDNIAEGAHPEIEADG